MRLYTFELNQQRKIGAEWNGQLIDLAAGYQAATINQPPEANPLRAKIVDRAEAYAWSS